MIASGSWATGVFRYRERDKEPRIALRRYRKRRAGWVVESKMTFSTTQAAAIALAFERFSSA